MYILAFIPSFIIFGIFFFSSQDAKAAKAANAAAIAAATPSAKQELGSKQVLFYILKQLVQFKKMDAAADP